MKALKKLCLSILFIISSILFVYLLGTSAERQRNHYDYYNPDLDEHQYDSENSDLNPEDNAYYFGSTLPVVEVIADKMRGKET
ncbi:MAG: hypothetical protein AAF985_05800 [Bacteroidota bacterium]